MESILQNSFCVQNWKIVVISIIIITFVTYFIRSVKTAKIKLEKYEKNTQLDGEECVGSNFIDEENISCLTPSLQVKKHIPYSGAQVTLLPGGAHQFYRMANNRRSVRAYSRKSVPIQVIEDCIRAAGTAPSGAHTEPWTFCLVGDTELKQQIRDIVETEERLNYEQRMHRQWTADLRPLRTDHIKQYLTDAPFLVLVFKQTYGQTVDGRRRQHYYHEISVAISTGILLCALQAAGLSSLVTTPLNCGPALRTLLQRPMNEKLLVLLPVGYPAEGCLIPELKRKNLNEILVQY